MPPPPPLPVPYDPANFLSEDRTWTKIDGKICHHSKMFQGFSYFEVFSFSNIIRSPFIGSQSCAVAKRADSGTKSLGSKCSFPMGTLLNPCLSFLTRKMEVIVPISCRICWIIVNEMNEHYE